MEASSTFSLPMTTALELPGQRVTTNLGVTFGLVVRSLGVVKGVTATFAALRRREVSQYTEMLEDARRQALDRLVANAELLGADAIVSVRFDSTEMGQGLAEIFAYGTAVKVEPAG